MKPLAILPCLFSVCLMGCTAEKEAGEAAALVNTPAADTAEAAMLQIRDGMANGQPIVAWNALPESYQADVNELVQTFGKNMDAETWKQITTLLGSIHQLLDEKQEFIFNHPGIAEGTDPESAKKGVVQITGLLKTILDGAGDLEALKSFDGATFMETTGAKAATQISALVDLMPEGGAGNPVPKFSMKDVKIETVESTDSTATLKIVQADGKEELQQFVKSQGKWLPKDMVDEWDQNMQEAREGLAALPEQSAGLRMKVMGVSGMVSGMLAALQSAETQEQFNAGVGNLMSGAGMMLGPMMGMGGPSPVSIESKPVKTAEPTESLNDTITSPAESESPAEPAGK